MISGVSDGASGGGILGGGRERMSVGRNENEGLKKTRVCNKETQRPGERTPLWGAGGLSGGALHHRGVRAETGCADTASRSNLSNSQHFWVEQISQENQERRSVRSLDEQGGPWSTMRTTRSPGGRTH